MFVVWVCLPAVRRMWAAAWRVGSYVSASHSGTERGASRVAGRSWPAGAAWTLRSNTVWDWSEEFTAGSGYAEIQMWRKGELRTSWQWNFWAS